MSANNWTQCPRCEVRRAAEIDQMQQEVDAAYGHVDLDTFDRLRDALNERRASRPDNNMREDYEIGIAEREFFVDYRSSCSICGYSHTFKQSYPLLDLTAEQVSA